MFCFFYFLKEESKQCWNEKWNSICLLRSHRKKGQEWKKKGWEGGGEVRICCKMHQKFCWWKVKFSLSDIEGMYMYVTCRHIRIDKMIHIVSVDRQTYMKEEEKRIWTGKFQKPLPMCYRGNCCTDTIHRKCGEKQIFSQLIGINWPYPNLTLKWIKCMGKRVWNTRRGRRVEGRKR